jgi:hypothetical protein
MTLYWQLLPGFLAALWAPWLGAYAANELLVESVRKRPQLRVIQGGKVA